MILATRALMIASAIYFFLALALCNTPLFDVLGYEFCFALNCVVAVVSPHLGAMLSYRIAPPISWSRRLYVSWLGTLLSLAPAFLAIAFNAVRVKNCNATAGVIFFALGPLSSGLWGATLGALVAQTWGYGTKQAKIWATTSLIALSAIPLGMCLVQLVTQPPIYVYDSLWGIFVGSLYDESVAPDRRWLALRAQTAFYVASVVALMAATAIERPAGFIRRTGWLFVAMSLWGAGQRVCTVEGLRRNRPEIASHLSVVRHRPGLIVHMPTGLSAKQADNVADDHAFRWTQLRSKMKLNPAWPLHSWVFADADDKALWLGGRDTMVAKPWLHEIYIHGTQTPHPVVAHEMVHALAAQWSPSLLRMPARWGLWVNLGLVEGLAVALAPPAHATGIAGQAAVLKKLGLLVPCASLLGTTANTGPQTFWRQPPARAYAQAGALVQMVWQQCGMDAIRSLYSGASLKSATGLTPAELEQRFHLYLTAHQPSAALVALNQGPLTRHTVFEQTCAHEVANLRRAASTAAPAVAEPLWRKAISDQGKNPEDILGLAQTLRALGRYSEAGQLERGVLSAGLLAPPQAATVRVRMALAYAQLAELAEAKALLAEVVSCPMPLAAVRTARMAQWVLTLATEDQKNLIGYLAGTVPAQKAQPLLAQLCTNKAGQKTDPCYLLARLYALSGSPRPALDLLATTPSHPFPPIAWEQISLKAALANQLDDIQAQQQALLAMIDRHDAPQGMRDQATDALARLRYPKMSP